jgi:hypothetical protein
MNDELKTTAFLFIIHHSAFRIDFGPPETRTQPSRLQGECAAINTCGPYLNSGLDRRIPTSATSSQDSDALSLHHVQVENFW